MSLPFQPNTLYYADCLDVMGDWVQQGRTVDLIYLDPPFNSNADYNVLYGKDQSGKPREEPAQFVAFEDTWWWSDEAATRIDNIGNAVAHPAHNAMRGLAMMLPQGGMLAYLSYIAERVAVMHKLLAGTGSLYFHCDSTASHYIKAILDCVFGAENFRGDIIWKSSPNKNDAGKRKFANRTNNIFHYSKSDDYSFRPVFVPLSDEHIAKSYRYEDARGRYMTAPLHANTPLGGWGKQQPFVFKGLHKRWFASLQTLQQLDAEDRLHISSRGGIRKKVYLAESKGTPASNLWEDIPFVSGKEALGYPTQKPVKLLERIITASSDEGDLILDPFCGCGTTAEAAWKLRRRFIGVDISPYAITRVCRERLTDPAGVAIKGLNVEGLPGDMESARAMAAGDRFAFEHWALSCLDGFAPNTKQVADGGIDGRGKMLNPPEGEAGYCVAQVKSGKVSPDSLRAFLSQLAAGKFSMGLFIMLEKKDPPTPVMREVAAAAGTFQAAAGTRTYDRIVFWSIEEYFAGVEPRLPDMTDPDSGKPLQPKIPKG